MTVGKLNCFSVQTLIYIYISSLESILAVNNSLLTVKPVINNRFLLTDCVPLIP